ncbi:MAG TPA: HEAT repeat domain-containing protein, partial [Oscillatoriaceae cyanobacterium]
ARRVVSDEDLAPSLGGDGGPELAPALGATPPLGRAWWHSLKGPISVLLADLERGTPTVRRRAAEALVRMGDRRAVPALAERCRDEHPEVRLACVKALARLGGDGALPALHRACQDSHAHVRLAAAEGVARLGNESSLGVLETLRGHACDYGLPSDVVAVERAIAELTRRLG